MALNTVVQESRAGDLARRSSELARDVASLLGQLPPTDALLAPLTNVSGKLDDVARQFRRLEARLVKERWEAEAARVAAEIAAQDSVINAP